MVFQRDQPIHIWGNAVPGKTIVVSFGKESKSLKVNPDSTWHIHLNKQKANVDPQVLNIFCGSEKISLQNTLIGDVWVCIGQSNMEWPMMKEMHFKEEINNSHQPLLRFYNPAYTGKNIFGTTFTDSVIQRLNKERFYEGEWQQSDSNTVKTMSAVAYYFGKEIAGKVKVPVGLINLSIGGAPLETFIDKEVLKNNQQFSAKVNGDWLNNEALPVWIRERGRQNLGAIWNVEADEYGKNHAFKPGFAYSGGIEQIIPMPVKGILCYQGESNAQEIERVNEYAALSTLMIDDYRRKWEQPQLPFYFVQLSSIDTTKYKGQLWPEFRNEQLKMLELIPNSGMAVCSDIGAKDDVHPTNKKDVGERLARWALNRTYKQNIVPSGPLPMGAKYEKGKVIISFQYMAKALKTVDGDKLKGLSLNGKTDVEAVIRGTTILIFTKTKPAYVFYGWKPFSDGNLVNSENLPASTFKIKVQ
ncbi:MAG TPA: sialate O-acetylesterase [Chitinophagaceae bacterium]